MTALRVLTGVLVGAPWAAAAAGCGPDVAVTAGPSTTAEPGRTAPASPSVQQPSASTSSKDDAMELQITIDGRRFRATLDDSAASRDLISQLPQTVEMRDHGGVEKTGPLRSPLSSEGQPPGADPEVGDVGYYAPGNDLVLYYGDQSYWDGIIVLGRLAGDAAARIAEMTGPVTATIESHHGPAGSPAE